MGGRKGREMEVNGDRNEDRHGVLAYAVSVKSLL